MKAKVKKTLQAVPVLDETPPEGKSFLLLRNIRHRAFGFVLEQPEKVTQELKLNSQEEKVVPAIWVKSPGVRKAVSEGAVEAEWVAELYQARVLPIWEQAPTDVRPENPQQRNFAMEIAYADEAHALELANITVHIEGSNQIDKGYMRASVLPALRGAKWAEEQVRDRSKITKAIDSRIAQIEEGSFDTEETEEVAASNPFS